MSKSRPKSKSISKPSGDADLPPVIESSGLKAARDIDHTLDVEAVREDALREVGVARRHARATASFAPSHLFVPIPRSNVCCAVLRPCHVCLNSSRTTPSGGAQ